jgi:hypothetical protein
MAKQRAPKIKVGELKKVVGGLKSENKTLTERYDKTSNAMDNDFGLANDFETGKMQATRDRAIKHNQDKINRYGKLIDSVSIVHDKARLAEKEAAYKRDYPLSTTYKNKK